MGVVLQELRKKYPKASTEKLKQIARAATVKPPNKAPAKKPTKPKPYHVGLNFQSMTPAQTAAFASKGITPQTTPYSQMVTPGKAPLPGPQGPSVKPSPTYTPGVQPKPAAVVKPVATAPPKPVVNVPPPDPLYDTTVARLNRDRASQEAEFAYQEGQTRQDYGIDDATNPYSRAKALERTYLQSKRGASGSYAAQGQLYSGALSNALDETRYGYDSSYDSLSRSYQQALHGYAQGRAGSQTAYSDALAQAEQDRINRALANRPADPGIPAVPKPAAAKPAPAPAAAKPAPAAKGKPAYGPPTGAPLPKAALPYAPKGSTVWAPTQAAEVIKKTGLDPKKPTDKQQLINIGALPPTFEMPKQVLTSKGYVTPKQPALTGKPLPPAAAPYAPAGSKLMAPNAAALVTKQLGMNPAKPAEKQMLINIGVLPPTKEMPKQVLTSKGYVTPKYSGPVVAKPAAKPKPKPVAKVTTKRIERKADGSVIRVLSNGKREVVRGPKKKGK